MTGRLVVLFVLLCCGAVAAVPAGRVGRGAGDVQTAAASIELDIALTASRLAAGARAAMTDEADRIWRPHRIGLRWRSGAGGDADAADLRVVVVAQAEAAEAAEHWTTVAELLPHAGDRASIIVSISAARQVLRDATPSSPGTSAQADDRLGLVLGRALAHEIGHFLLGTETHASTGLMRALIPPSQLGGAETDPFLLDDAARRWLDDRRRGIRGNPLSWLRAGRFANGER